VSGRTIILTIKILVGSTLTTESTAYKIRPEPDAPHPPKPTEEASNVTRRRCLCAVIIIIIIIYTLSYVRLKPFQDDSNYRKFICIF
jgi:hypothetical protein